MKTGTIENLEEPNETKPFSRGRGRVKAPGGRSGGAGDGGNNGSPGGGDKSGGPKRGDFGEPGVDLKAEKFRVLMWFLLMVVLMTFGGLIAAYVVLSTTAALEWRPFDLPFQVWISTTIILISSLTYHLGEKALKAGENERSKKFFLVTTALGGMFISSQVLTWFALVERGLYMAGSQYAGFFYILTAVHAIHVIGGVCALGYVLLKTWNRIESKAEQARTETNVTAIGWYWHTMDGLWLILLFLLGFWK